jgi:hypothetical protein
MGPDVDPYEGVAADANSVDVLRLRGTLGLQLRHCVLHLRCHREDRVIASTFDLASRTRGYHGVLHQLVSINVCPAHRFPMLTTCRRCGYEAPSVVRAELLEMPYRCANCRRNYGGRSFYPNIHTPMRLDHRIAITRLCYQRRLR